MNPDTLSKPAVSPAVATVLLVDDEPVSRLSMAARLKRMGLRVLEAGNGKEGLAILRRERPDLTILDWVMPGMDGPTVCEQVRQDPDILSSQLILMTSHDQPEQIAEGLARGADDFLSKAASKQEILARVQSSLRAASLVRSIESARDELRAKQDELERELRSAADYIHSLLPAAGNATPGIRMSWIYRPSLALGGDLFNFSTWDDQSAYFYILDASGHGVSPALRAASFATFLRAENLRHCIRQNDPAAMLVEANRRYPLTEDGSYFTIWIGSFDRTTHQLRYATAGHGGALMQRRDGSIEWLTHAHLPLGFEPDSAYELTTVQIADGDRVILMSDGIYEAPAPTGELWGTTRLETTLMAHRSAPLGEALPALMAEAERWHGSPVFPDDAALLGLEFRL
ncbi:MAG: SpoIIE family protein phosphatase [Nitrospira sp.]|nr:SpoIIE family protein phosphatase [Nitrospira sp.]